MYYSKEFDLVIIGSGVISSVLLRSLQETKLKVGFLVGFDAAQARPDVFLNGELVSHQDLYGSFRSGGNSGIWGGRLGIFDPWDFRERPWIDGKRWPIEYSEVLEHAPKAVYFLGASDEELASNSLLDEEVFGNLRARSELWVKSNDNWVDSLSRNKNRNISFIYDYNLERLIFSSTKSRVEELILVNSKSERIRLRSSTVILSAGVLGNIQILARASSDYPLYFSEIGENIGRNVFSHHLVKFSQFHPKSSEEFDFSRENPWRRRCLCINREDQERLGIGSSVIFFAHSNSNALTIKRSWNRIKRSSNNLVMEIVSVLVRNPKNFYRLFLNFLLGLIRSMRSGGNSRIDLAKSQILHVWGEQLPAPQNAIYVEHNQEKTIVKISLTYSERETKLLLDSVGASIPFITCLNEAGQPLDMDSAMRDAKEEILDTLNKPPLLAHIMGGTSMGSSLRDSVVDANLRVHKIENLYVVGNSVLPSGGAFGPTLVSACLALRLVEHLTKSTQFDRNSISYEL